jgi:hypothetical protein
MTPSAQLLKTLLNLEIRIRLCELTIACCGLLLLGLRFQLRDLRSGFIDTG